MYRIVQEHRSGRKRLNESRHETFDRTLPAPEDIASLSKEPQIRSAVRRTT